VSVTCYGYFRRDLTAAERTIFAVISFAGYWALCDRGITPNLVFGAMLLGMGAYVVLTTHRAPVRPRHAERAEPVQKVAAPAMPLEGRFE
jgi:hypothetical protein